MSFLSCGFQNSIKPLAFTTAVNAATIFLFGLISSIEIFPSTYTYDHKSLCHDRVFPYPIVCLLTAVIWVGLTIFYIKRDRSGGQTAQTPVPHTPYDQEQRPQSENLVVNPNNDSQQPQQSQERDLIWIQMLFTVGTSVVLVRSAWQSLTGLDFCDSPRDAWPILAMITLGWAGLLPFTTAFFFLSRPKISCFETKSLKYWSGLYLTSFPMILLWLMVPFSANSTEAKQQYQMQEIYNQHQQQQQQQSQQVNQIQGYAAPSSTTMNSQYAYGGYDQNGQH